MKLTELFYDSEGTARAKIIGESGIEYVCCLSINLEPHCSCPAFIFDSEGKPCKHVRFLYHNLEKNKMVKLDEKLRRLDTGSKIINNMLGGGIPYGGVVAVFAEPDVGKSNFGYQIGLGNLKDNKKNTLLINTEELIEEDLVSLLRKFNNNVWKVPESDISKRFKVTHTQDNPQLQSIQKLMQMFGYLVMIEISKKGKYTVKFQTCNPTLTDKELENTSMIILDSLTMPIKDSIGSETQNFPARAQITGRLFGELSKIARRFKIAVIVMHHATVNPVTPFGIDLGKAYGGSPIMYNSKYVINFLNATKAIKDETGWGIEARRIRLIRKTGTQTTGDMIPIRLKKDVGFVDE